MGEHLTPATAQAQLQTYATRVNVALDRFKHGDISQSEAIASEHDAAALLVDALRSAFLIRLRNLEALRVPRGEVVPPATGAHRG